MKEVVQTGVKDICGRDVVICFKHVTLSEAARVMRERHVGCLVVVEETDQGRIPIGMVTDRDIVVSVVAKDLDARNIAVGEVMATQLITAREDDSILDATRQMRRHGVRRMPVLRRDGVLSGIVTLDDLLVGAAGQLHELAAAIEREQVKEKKVRN